MIMLTSGLAVTFSKRISSVLSREMAEELKKEGDGMCPREMSLTLL